MRYEKYNRNFTQVDDTISTLEFKVNDINKTALQAFNTTSTNLNEIINIKPKS